MANLTRVEAEARAALIDVTAYDVRLDLSSDEATFGSEATVRFTCHRPGESTFVDLKPATVHRITLNGKEIDPSVLVDERVTLDGLQAENELCVAATMRFSNDGQGLHRAVDPADGLHYVYGHLFLDAAPRVFACFDQPDLKAPYDVHVTAPADWVVIGNGAATKVAPGQWQLARTRPLSTYFVTVCAGPYVSVTAEHDGVPLGLHARASLKEPLERHAEQMLDVTRRGFDYYHALFGIRYPFGEYHQVFVPEFNAGAMENPGCIVLRDQYIFRGAATDDEIMTRANTIVHELAHMWFGDMVTMTWWDDLWLNESFAEYMSHRTLFDATEFADAWVDSTMSRKTWGYAAERTPSTHPVAGSPAPDAQAALGNFDGISYAKGAAVLRQLIAHIGDEAFIAGVGDYLRTHAWSNATLADFLAAMEKASGRRLAAWADAWLRTAGLDVLELDASAENGVVTQATLRRSTPAAYPADRPHTFDVAGFTGGAEVFRVHTVLTDDRAPLTALVGAATAAVTVPNASDLTWATVTLDAGTLAALPEELALVEDAQARAVVWAALLDGVCRAEVDPRHLLRVYTSSLPVERSLSIVDGTGSAVLTRIVPEFLPPAETSEGYAAVAGAAGRLLSASEPGSSMMLAAARFMAASTADVALLTRWAAGTALPQGLEGDRDFRWVVLRNLASRGAIGAAEIDDALARDHTMHGSLSALRARACAPDAAAKAWAWEQITGDHGHSNYELHALATGFWRALDLDVVRPYVPRFFRDVPALKERMGQDALARVVVAAYPGRVVEQATADASAEALERSDLSAAVRRAIVDADSRLHEALRSRARFGS